MRVWRICNARRAASALSGEGARLYSGRWNPVGVPMVYTATSLALAAIEVFVHLDPRLPPLEMVSVEAELGVDEAACERVALRDLPADWHRERHPELQRIGAEWIESRRSLVLLAPSAAIADSWNALVNPEHPEARRIRIVERKPFRFDERMFR